jgi:hypothetical protein
MGGRKNININKSLDGVDSKPHELILGFQDLSGGSNCHLGGNRNRTRIRSEA